MKKVFILFAAALFAGSMFSSRKAVAQAPQKMSYQAVVRNESNELITNTQVGDPAGCG